jgi:predicted TIM-barrel fold metal-dependent hydrolase
VLKKGKAMKKALSGYSGFIIWMLAVSFNLHAQSKLEKIPFRIDSHIHLYDTNREGSSTFLDPVKNKKIYFPHLIPEFLKVAVPSGVNYAIVIEASKRREDNFWAMNVVNESTNLLAFIANLDPRDPHYISDLDVLSKNKKFRGIRIRPITKIDLSDQSVINKLGELAKRKLALELGPNEGPIEAIETIARKYPEMNFIMDHMAGGKIQNNEIVPDNWNIRLERLAALPNVYCKVSALFDLSGQSPAPFDANYYRQFIDRVVHAFGPDRILFGSNWTLSEMYGTYEGLVGIYDQYLEKKKGISASKFYAENAIKAYGLKIKEY